MSLYNMVNGNHPYSGELLGVLGVTEENFTDLPRYRDVFVYESEIRVLLKSGGGNREEPEWAEKIEKLKGHPLYLSDWDDVWDGVFMWVQFRFPETDAEVPDRFTGANGKATVEEVTRFLGMMFSMIEEAVRKEPEMRARLLPENMHELTNFGVARIEAEKS